MTEEQNQKLEKLAADVLHCYKTDRRIPVRDCLHIIFRFIPIEKQRPDPH